MTKLLEKAFATVSKLPPKQQDEVAAHLLEELADEKKWAKTFADSQAELSQLAAEAVAEYKAGKTKPLNEDIEFADD